MAKEIVNRVAKSPIMTVDLEDFYPNDPRIGIDIKSWLFKELILKEQDFRAALKAHDWTQYSGAYVAVYCSVDAIVPSWAYMLIASYLTPHTKGIQHGTLDQLEQAICNQVIANLEVSNYVDKPVIIKGCSSQPIPENAYVLLTQKIQPVAKSVMFGEACSAVPIYKKPK